jgi:hypothetical protein
MSIVSPAAVLFSEYVILVTVYVVPAKENVVPDPA